VDARTLDMLIAEIGPRIEGARIATAAAPSEHCVALELDGGARGRRTITLAASTAKWLPLLCLTDDPGPPIGRDDRRPSPRHADVVRMLRGGVIESIARTPGTRRVEIVVSRVDPLGRETRRTVAIDLGGRPGVTLAETRRRTDDRGPDADGPEAEGRPTAAVSWWRDDRERLHVRIGPTPHPRATGTRPFESANAAAVFALREFRRPLDLEHRRLAVERALGAMIRRKERALEKVRAELDDAGRAEDYRHRGRLLLARKDQVGRGRRTVTLLDFDGMTEMEIEIDPRLDAAANAEVLFRRARKSDRRAARTPARLAEIEREIASLREAAASVGAASDDDLARLERRHLPPARPRGRSSEAERGPKFRRYVVTGGWEVLVGKSNRDNDLLTHRMARPDDLWFHARQAPGSHVVMRRAGRADNPSPDAIREAAEIAAFHSKAGRSSKVAVCYAEKRYVRKPRGAKPGLAVVTREKVIMVRPRTPGS